MKKISTITLLCLLCTAMYAQSDTTTALVMAPVEVTADRISTRRFEAPEIIRVVSRRQIESTQARTTPEALWRTCGVFVQKTNHGGGSPFVRGLTGNQTLLVLDGIRLNNATFRYGPNQYLNTIDVFSVGRIEVLAGGGSTQYGSDALGGTVVLHSELPHLADQAHLYARGQMGMATQGMERTGRAQVGWRQRRWALEAGLTGRRFGDLVGGDTTGRQSPSGYREWAWDLRGRVHISNRWQLSAAHRYLQQLDVPVYHKVQLENFRINAFQPQTKSISWVKNEWAGTGRFQKIALTLAHQWSDEGRISQKNNSSVRRTERDGVRTLSASAQSNVKVWMQHPTVLGAEIYHDVVSSSRHDWDETTAIRTNKRGLYPDGATQTQSALFVLQAWHPHPRWVLNAGVRGQYTRINVQDADNGRVRLQLPATVGSGGILFKTTAHSAFFSSFNTAFRAPNVDDLGALGIVDFRYEVPNYDLRPERSYNTQVGWRYNGRLLRSESTLFRNELRNLITRVRQGQDSLQGYPVFVKVNSEKGYIQGLEQTLRWQWHRYWSVDAAVAYALGHNLSRREPLRRIPPLNGRMALVFEKKRWSATAELMAADNQDRLAAGDRDDNRIPLGGTPGWSVLNLYAQWTYGPLAVSVAVNNLFNEDYRYHGSGINGVGRSASLRLVYNASR
jgi:hemoglobin/transferrin/lactoferrin receptor protein